MSAIPSNSGGADRPKFPLSLSFGFDPDDEEYNSEEHYPEVPIGRGLTAQLLWLTPDLARKFLKKLGKKQRNLRPRNLEAIATDIREGRWRLNGETIIFDRDGYLVNGRHRCEAVIREDVPILIVVIRNVAPAAYSTQDSGAIRYAKDAIASEGIANSSFVSTAAGLLRRYENRMLKGMDNYTRIKISPAATTETSRLHPGLAESAKVIHSLGKISRSLGAMTFCHYILSSLDGEAAARFFHGFATGEELRKGNPILALRARFTGQASYDMEDAVIYVFKAWNAFRRGKSLQQIQFQAGEQFPYPV